MPILHGLFKCRAGVGWRGATWGGVAWQLLCVRLRGIRSYSRIRPGATGFGAERRT